MIREALYVCEYLEDGYSANMAQLLYNNPQGYFCYINQRLKFDTTIKQKCADTIRYLAMAIAHSEKNIIKIQFIQFLQLVCTEQVIYFILSVIESLRLEMENKNGTKKNIIQQ
ncbi:MAG: hypothetical protein ACLS5E_06585 [[Ruminococcus] lactaris]